ncbi:MAG TPA: hypothetical protein PK605_00465 [Ignavibacteria bacterium]|nr:hypothetical protein [Bacteroidota bacterium]HRE10746.1 hypothetical protein [Ignavibacteria bacterium]HRF66012.1 hypothetical protein [Ignavibacteria bacterium]HRJ02852.1 hypothetical protein [Ignavibacteria bacterium]HRJ84410.1 hypothetical protein [Ignavibacteria bacterium]
MSKKLGLTGTSYKFKIIVVYDVGAPVIYSFNGGNHKQLDEYDMGKATRHKFNDGGKEKLGHYIEKEWVLDFSGWLPTEEGVWLNEIKNAEFFDGAKIYLMPHDDVEISYKVLVIEDKRKLEHYQNEYSTSKGYIIAFENASPILRYNWSDPSNKVYHTIDEMDFV